jgi:hypothetical protein
MESLSTIKIFNSRVEAEIAKSFLESFGIKSVIFSDDAGQSITSLQSVRGVKLMTGKKTLKKAISLLSEQINDL